MVNTNELLSIAFSLITSFTNVVNVPPQGVPHSPADLTRIGLINPTTDSTFTWHNERDTSTGSGTASFKATPARTRSSGDRDWMCLPDSEARPRSAPTRLLSLPPPSWPGWVKPETRLKESDRR
jgi:hypothetical protein